MNSYHNMTWLNKIILLRKNSLGEIRENLVDIAISSGESFQMNEERLLNDIKTFLFGRLETQNT